MVHALRQTHRLLRPNGLLISVHDLPTPQVIEIHARGTLNKVGWLLDRDDFENTRSSLNALAQVVADRDFILEDEQDFPYNIYADDLPELQRWLSEWWASAILTDKTALRLEELTQDASQPTSIVLALRARMTKLRVAGR
jgi:hypothetical protein